MKQALHTLSLRIQTLFSAIKTIMTVDNVLIVGMDELKEEKGSFAFTTHVFSKDGLDPAQVCHEVAEYHHTESMKSIIEENGLTDISLHLQKHS